MRVVTGERRDRWPMARRAAWWVPVLLASLCGPAALAQTPTPSPGPPTLEGSVAGSREAGGDLVIQIDVRAPGGWQGLHLIEAVLLVGDREAERIRYDIEDAQLAVGDQEIYAGTGASASGSYLRVAGSEVVVTTGGGNLSFRLRAHVLQAIPEDASFELSTTTDRGEVVSVRRGFAEPASGGLTWGTVVTAVVAALLAGAVIGNLFASRRRPPPRLSVYGTIQRRLDAERSEVAK
jgi:hypothetical protein